MTHRVRVDWAKDGTFGTTGQDVVTDQVRGALQASYGRDQASTVSVVVSGRGSVTLDNSSRRYSPRNTSSPLFGNLKPARPVVWERTVAGVTHVIFRGHTDDSPINPDADSRTVAFSLLDGLAYFRGVTVTTELHEGIRTGEAIDIILDEVGWTGGRDLDVGASVLPWWWEDGTDALEALQRVVASEGPPALLTMAADGSIVFRDRHHRLQRSASTTSQATWRGGDDDAEPVMARGFAYDDAWRNIVNDVRISVGEREVARERSVVWSTETTINIAASASRTIVLQASDPFRDAVTPQSGFDYQLLSGSLSSVTLSRTSGQSTTITLTAGAGGARMRGIQLRAWSVPVGRTYQVTAKDQTSVDDYGSRGLPSGMEPVWCSVYDAEALADLYVLQRKQPLPLLTVRFVCALEDSARLAALLARDLSDRVTVVEPETGVNGAFFIESIAHEAVGVNSHEIVFGLEAAPSAPSNPFILNTSTLNGAATLGY